MSQLNERGAISERNSALWGTGGRGGDRSSVLWGKGGPGVVVACMFAFVLAAPLAALAKSNTAFIEAPTPRLVGFLMTRTFGGGSFSDPSVDPSSTTSRS